MHTMADDQQFRDAAGMMLPHRLPVYRLVEPNARGHLDHAERKDQQHRIADEPVGAQP